MPEGPFNFPRITNIGPFVEKEAEQKFVVEQNQRDYLAETGIEDKLAKERNVENPRNGDFKRIELTLRVQTEEPDKGLGLIERPFKRTEFIVAESTYTYDPSTKVAIAGRTAVDEELRHMGIGTELAQRREQDMITRGIKEVWAIQATEGGKALLEKLNFTREGPLFPDDESVWYKNLEGNL